MTMIQMTDTPPQPAMRKAGMHALNLALTGWLGARSRRQRRLHELDELAGKPDWQLADIGVERTQIIRERNLLVRS